MAKKVSKKPAPSKAGGRSKGHKTTKVPVQSIVQFVAMLQRQGRADEFAEAAKKSKLFVTMRPSSVKFVREFVANNRLTRAMTLSIVDPCPGGDFNCPRP